MAELDGAGSDKDKLPPGHGESVAGRQDKIDEVRADDSWPTADSRLPGLS
jgi:hypothetical protein